MVKFKKIIAAAAAAVTMGAIGLTAFAAETLHAFYFDIGDEVHEIGGSGFSNGAIKHIGAPLGEALVAEGNPAPSRSEPLTLYIASYPNTLPKYRASEFVDYIGAADNYVKNIWYLEGQGKVDVEYYLGAMCGEYNLKVSGVWHP